MSSSFTLALPENTTKPLEGVKISTNHLSAIDLGRADRDDLYAFYHAAQLLNATETHIAIGDNWTKVISLGPVTIVLTFDSSTFKGSAHFSIYGVPLPGTVNFSKDDPVDIKIGTSFVGAEIDVHLDEKNSVYLKVAAWAFTKRWSFDKKIW